MVHVAVVDVIFNQRPSMDFDEKTDEEDPGEGKSEVELEPDL